MFTMTAGLTRKVRYHTMKKYDDILTQSKSVMDRQINNIPLTMLCNSVRLLKIINAKQYYRIQIVRVLDKAKQVSTSQ